MTYQPRTACTACYGFAQPGTVALMQDLLVRFPWVFSLGIYNCRPVAGGTTLSQHSCGRAGDAGIPTLPGGGANTTLGFPVVRFLDQFSTEFGIVEQIYARVIYDRQSPGGRVYAGVHPHYDHDHWTQTPGAAATLTRARIVEIAGPPGGSNEDDTMTAPEFVRRIRKPDVEAICMAKGPGGLWVISPDSGDRAAVTSYYVSILNQPNNGDWVGFYEEVQVAALINSATKTAGAGVSVGGLKISLTGTGTPA